MKLKYYFTIFLSLCLTLSSCTSGENLDSKTSDPYKLKGDWESSGGDGVLCFFSEEEKFKSTPSLNQILNDKKSLQQKAKSIQALENYEYLDNGIPLWTNLKGLNDREAILSIVMKRVEKYAPNYAEKVKLAMDSINVDGWHGEFDIANIDDSTPVRELSSNCTLVQLVDRQTQSSEGLLPKARVFFRKILFDMMSPLDQALMIWHEALYLIGRETGHYNSNDLRPLNALLFSEKLSDGLNESEFFSINAKNFQLNLATLFGDYIRFFIQEDYYKDAQKYKLISHKNNFTRSHSFIVMNQDMRNFIYNCYEASSNVDCRDQLMQTDAITKLVDTDEKAFLFLMNYYFDNYGLEFGSTEHLYVIDHKNPLEQDDSVQIYLGYVCGVIESFTFQTMGLNNGLIQSNDGLPLLEGEQLNQIHSFYNDKLWFKAFLVPSLRYCNDIRRALRH